MSSSIRVLLTLTAIGLSCVTAMAQDESDSSFRDPYLVRDDVEEIFSSPEFRGVVYQRSDAEITDSDFEMGEMPEWVKQTATAIGSVLGPALIYIFWIVLAIICCLIVYVIYTGITGTSLKRETEGRVVDEYEEGDGGRPPGEYAADVYLNRAAELAAAGQTREAIGQLLLGAMSYIEREELIRFRRGLTSRDYLRAVRSRAELYAALKNIVGIYEPICFGRREALTEHYQSSLEGYLAGFHAT